MAYSYSADLTLGAANTGLTLTPTLRNSDGTLAAGMVVVQNFEVAVGSGSYYFEATIPDGHRGYVQFLSGATFKAKTVVSAQEVENPDVKTSTRSSHTAADVWLSGTRTLSAFSFAVDISAAAVALIWDKATSALTTVGSIGKLLVDNINATISSRLATAGYTVPPTVGAIADQVWDEALAGHLTAGSTGEALNNASDASSLTAADVWSYDPRTLTQQIAAVSPPPVVLGSVVTIVKGDTMVLPFTDLGDITGRGKLWFSIKDDPDDDDDEAVVFIEESAGLVTLNGAAATSGQGSIAVSDQAAGDLTVTLDEAASVELTRKRGRFYSVKVLDSGAATTLTRGTVDVTWSTVEAVA